MDFWDMSVDDALSGIPASIPIAEETLTQYASSDPSDPLSSLRQSEGASSQVAEEIDASESINAGEATEKTVPKEKQRARNDSSNENAENAVSLKRAYFDVKKFAIAGMEGAEKEEAKVRLAISLGAKPKKKKPVNYKDLKRERSEAKKAAAEDRSAKLRQGGVKKKTKGSGKKAKKIPKKNRRRR